MRRKRKEGRGNEKKDKAGAERRRGGTRREKKEKGREETATRRSEKTRGKAEWMDERSRWRKQRWEEEGDDDDDDDDVLDDNDDNDNDSDGKDILYQLPSALSDSSEDDDDEMLSSSSSAPPSDNFFSESDESESDELPSQPTRGRRRSAVQPGTDDDPDPPSQDEPFYPADRFGWSRKLKKNHVHKFRGKIPQGPTMDRPENDMPLLYFLAFFPIMLFRKIARYTNIAGRGNPRFTKLTTPEEIKAWVGIRMVQGVHRNTNYDDDWSTDPSLRNARVAATLSTLSTPSCLGYCASQLPRQLEPSKTACTRRNGKVQGHQSKCQTVLHAAETCEDGF